MLPLVVNRFLDRAVWKLLAHESFGVINVISDAIPCLRIALATAVDIQLGAIDERAPLRVATLVQQHFNSIRRVSFFQTPAKIVLPMWIDKRERQHPTTRQVLLQLGNEIRHLLKSRVRKDGVRKND